MKFENNEAEMQERIKKTRERYEQDRTDDQDEEDSSDGQKFCPFRSTPEKLVPCDGDCMLYRENKPGYECYFMELQSISYFMSGKKKKAGKK